MLKTSEYIEDLYKKIVFLAFYSYRETVPMLLVANKIDLSRMRQISQEDGKLLSNQLKVIILSANMIFLKINF